MKNNIQTEVINDLKKRKKISREYLRGLSPIEKISRLVDLQEQYYQMLMIREQTAGVRFPKDGANGTKRDTRMRLNDMAAFVIGASEVSF